MAGTNLTYTLTVTNLGTEDALGVQLSDTLSGGTTFVSFTAPAGWTSTAPAVGGTGTVTSTIPTLGGGAVASFTLVVRVIAATPDGATVSNTASVATTSADANATNNSDTETSSVVAQADLSITKNDSPEPVGVGGNLT